MKNHQKGKDHGHPRQEKIRRDVVQDQGPEREGEAGQGHVIKDEIEEMGTEIEGILSETGESQSVTGGMTEGSKGQGQDHQEEKDHLHVGHLPEGGKDPENGPEKGTDHLEGPGHAELHLPGGATLHQEDGVLRLLDVIPLQLGGMKRRDAGQVLHLQRENKGPHPLHRLVTVTQTAQIRLPLALNHNGKAKR